MLDNMEKLALSEIILSNKQAQEQGHLESDTTKQMPPLRDGRGFCACSVDFWFILLLRRTRRFQTDPATYSQSFP
jgi:hypothetical protein